MFIYKFKNLNLIFVFNKKCACTTIKNIINQIDNKYKLNKFTDVHKYSWKNTNIKSVMTDYKNYHVIFFIRNPYDRFISGYSKITNKLILQLRFDKSKNLKKCNKIVNYGDININQWANIIINIKPNNLDNHFKPQTLNIKNLLKHKNIKLYDIKNLSNLNKYINNLLKININLDIHLIYNRNREKIDSEIMKLIYKYYYEDFSKLGYSADDYL
jgi:hypothetical protein